MNHAITNESGTKWMCECGGELIATGKHRMLSIVEGYSVPDFEHICTRCNRIEWSKEKYPKPREIEFRYDPITGKTYLGSSNFAEREWVKAMELVLPVPVEGNESVLTPGYYLWGKSRIGCFSLVYSPANDPIISQKGYYYTGPFCVEQPMPEPEFGDDCGDSCNEFRGQYWLVLGKYQDCSIRIEHEDQRTAIEMFNVAVKVMRGNNE